MCVRIWITQKFLKLTWGTTLIFFCVLSHSVDVLDPHFCVLGHSVGLLDPKYQKNLLSQVEGVFFQKINFRVPCCAFLISWVFPLWSKLPYTVIYYWCVQLEHWSCCNLVLLLSILIHHSILNSYLYNC